VKRQLLSGNEAIALGAYHAGMRVAAAYPGTPSSEILQALTYFPDIYVEWSTNEKVAMEVVMGASYGGARAMASMKHVGLNVAADPFFAVSVTGVIGGLVVISADDPGMHSSQNEQDNRHYARFAKVPLLEPSDSQEAYELTRLAFQLSEEYDTPVIVRPTTRISHNKSVVEYDEDITPPDATVEFKHDPQKHVMVPSNARRRHPLMEERIEQLAQLAETFPYNRVEEGSTDLGVVTSGVAYQYAREAFPDASFLKLTLSYPLPKGLILEFAKSVKKVLVVEELDPFLEESLRVMGVAAEGKKYLPITGELSVDAVMQGGCDLGALSHTGEENTSTEASTLPLRAPALCPGCPHLGAAFALRKLGYEYKATPAGQRAALVPPARRKEGVVVTSDIGCYTLAVYPPLETLDTCGCMGASIGHAHGLDKAGVKQKVVAVLGDSTFMHSGITPLADVVYNRGRTTVIILDNGTTAMTGHQGHPGSGVSARGEEMPRIDLELLCHDLGVQDVKVVDSFDVVAVEKGIRESMENDAPSVVIVRGPCPRHVRLSGEPLIVDEEGCNGCRICLRVGCPALTWRDEKVYIEPTLCIGESCQLCVQACPRGAILHTKGE
jgi:indolepyruvate ferredoxin oxidoreductase alpha subunit